jgi:hypothetical protein
VNIRYDHTRLSRRDFLKLAATAALTAVGGRLLSACAPQNDQLSMPSSPQVRYPQMRELVHFAALAANSHNAQAWKFALKENSIELHPDFTRRLPVVDPDNRELWISLGCALENLLIAARAMGYEALVTYPEDADFIHVDLVSDQPRKTPLFDAIPLRQNTRSEYVGGLIEKAILGQLQDLSLEPGIVQHFALDAMQMETVVEYVHQGNLSQYADQAFTNELISWLRFNKKEAEGTQDGLYTRCSGNPEVPRWVGELFVSKGSPEQQAVSDDKKIRSSSGIVIIASEADHKAVWVRTGQVYQRLALTMTMLGIQSALINQPLEVPAIRTQFQTALGLGSHLPQFVMRFGRANLLPQSLRRPVDQLII